MEIAVNKKVVVCYNLEVIYHMKQISTISFNEYDQIKDLWELSVKATHDFIMEKDFIFFKNIIKKYFKNVNLCAIRDDIGKIIAFMGTSKDNIEMLFVHPAEMGKGIGTLLVNYAINELKIKKVDVNEQNKQAREFYEKMGFRVADRSALDNEGLPYPILHMTLK
jgi:putative acetyltransferase